MERHQDCLAGVGLHDDFFRHTLDAERALEYLAAALRTLSERQGIRFILIPHGTGDVEGLRALHDLCGAGTRDVTHFVGYVPLAQEVKRILGFCGHVITSRMHVAIGALGMGVPVTSFVYRGKFEGLYQHFGLTDGLLEPTEAARGVEPLLHTFTRRLARSADEAAWIAGRLPDIVKLARRNYENLCLTP
jgi:polysaccharide pyruvyl transferase WcaK-like protein